MEETFFKDFVNRGSELELLRKEAWEDNYRLLLIEGRLGIGKTNLLREFHHTSHKKQIQSVYIDLAKRPVGIPGYFYITETIIQQLEASGLDVEDLAKSLAETIDGLSRYEHISEQIDLDGIKQDIQEKISTPPGSQGKAAKFEFQADTKISHSQLAGNIYNIHKILLYEPKKIQENFQGRLTRDLKNCLKTFTAQHQTVFTLDHWKSGNDETQTWVMDNSLFPWVINQVFDMSYLVVSCDPLPDWYEGRRDYHHEKILKLKADDVRRFLVDLKHIPPGELPPNLDRYGRPLLMVMFAEDVILELKEAGRWKK